MARNSVAALVVSMINSELQKPMGKLEDSGICLIDEFKLICNKRSNLSRANREAVIHEFNKRFEPIKS